MGNESVKIQSDRFRWIFVVGILLAWWLLSGCQALARPTAVPTPTPIRLAPEATATQVPTGYGRGRHPRPDSPLADAG